MKRRLFLALIGSAASLVLSASLAAPQERAAGTAGTVDTVDINSAGVEELAELPGIGEVVAKRIVDYRDENGPFQKTEELMNVRGIGEKTYLKLEPMLRVGDEKSKKK